MPAALSLIDDAYGAGTFNGAAGFTDAATDAEFFGDDRFLPFLNHDGLITGPHARTVFDALMRACIWLASVSVQYRNSHSVSLYSMQGGKNVWRVGALGQVWVSMSIWRQGEGGK